jgi:succinate-acetate transporter protein
MSLAETRALSTMYSEGSVAHHDMAKGFFFRATLFSGAYGIFCLCLALLLFLLVAAIPIFLQDEAMDTVAREIILFAGAYYAMLVLLKMLTTTLPRVVWVSLTVGFVLFLAGNLWSLLRLLKIT